MKDLTPSFRSVYPTDFPCLVFFSSFPYRLECYLQPRLRREVVDDSIAAQYQPVVHL